VKVLVAMSGGVDSSVAAALVREAGHEAVGVTLRLWGGDSDTGCCSVADVDDARRAAQQLDIDHLVFNFSEGFHERVVDPYVRAHAEGRTPNPCIECNRHLKFDRLLARARLLGFDAVATGHHARIERDAHGLPRVARGADAAKDQSYVVHMLAADDLDFVWFPVGHMTKAAVREHATRLGLRTAAKPDSQDVCFISRDGGREAFLGARIPLRRGEVVDASGGRVGTVRALELVTVGQRRGLGVEDGVAAKRYVWEVDARAGRVVVGEEWGLRDAATPIVGLAWTHGVPCDGDRVRVQCSAHGDAHRATLRAVDVAAATAVVAWESPQRRVAPGQSVVCYDPSGRCVLGAGTAEAPPRAAASASSAPGRDGARSTAEA
jgi:tRNA-specific 2-thiouridylase